MRLNPNASLSVETRAAGVHVVRFSLPGVGFWVEEEDVTIHLFETLQTAILDQLSPGETLVLNLDRIKPFATPFYRLLLCIRKAVLARQAHLVLCHLSPDLLEIFKVFQAFRLFPITPTEAEAVGQAVTLARI